MYEKGLLQQLSILVPGFQCFLSLFLYLTSTDDDACIWKTIWDYLKKINIEVYDIWNILELYIKNFYSSLGA